MSKEQPRDRGTYKPPLLLLPGMFCWAAACLLVLAILSFGVVLYPLFILIPVLLFELIRRMIWRDKAAG
jgi:hypothetical protein